MLKASGVPSTPSPPTVGKLDTLTRVRRQMTRLYKEARTGTLETQEATRLCFLLVSIAKLIESSDLERRIEAMEATLSGIGKSK
jgi:hypothetical protein